MTQTYHEEAGKGSNRRPDSISQEQFRINWDLIFGKKNVETVCKSCNGSGGIYDCGWFYECTVCNKQQ